MQGGNVNGFAPQQGRFSMRSFLGDENDTPSGADGLVAFLKSVTSIDNRRFKRRMPIDVAERHRSQGKYHGLNDGDFVIATYPAGCGEGFFPGFKADGFQLPDENGHRFLVDRRPHDSSPCFVAELLKHCIRAVPRVSRADHFIPRVL